MASRELVGRPLVPFFDADDNVNDTLAADASRSFESLDVDARVWNRELGYFEYPSEPVTTTASSSSGSSTNGDSARKNASAPIAIPPKRGAQPSASRVLLTPAMMLSSSCPDAAPLANERDHALLQQAAEESTVTRSASAKRASKQDKGRSNTPARRRSKAKQGAAENDETVTVAATTVDEAASGREGKATGRRGARTKNKEASRGPPPKARDELGTSSATAASAGAGKWAWSAFQSSPDPKHLPLPPFLAPAGVGSPGGAAAQSAPPPARESSVLPGQQHALAAVLLPDRPPEPTTPPEAAAQPMSRELSMTQDLRRLLNIGGG
ncbi:hypothetical protein PybrP1_011889 [[Pythium] brassicae (nom. inval.)]|nr:hypothetical protein PybrP1_011889 [[Pythium] brassicae (nom. inval.)]